MGVGKLPFTRKGKIREVFRRCRESFYLFAKYHLKIKNKSGKTVSLIPNAAQKIVHDALEKQKAETGKVRAIIIKGRQQGVSTYVQARYFWKLVHEGSMRAYILTHLSDSTQALFSMAKRFIENLPLYYPELGKCNVNELYFNVLNMLTDKVAIDSGYRVGTAGSHGVGRGETLQLFHGSEVAYWPNPEEHVTGILQAVPNEEGTEVILESTANGTGNLFHTMCLDALASEGGFELIFIPWTLQDEYTGKVNSKNAVSLSSEEKVIKQQYKLTDGQLAWRRLKIKELGDERRFRQEYPLCVGEAFIADTERAFVSGAEVDAAAEHKPDLVEDSEALLVMGIDPARLGGDDTAICLRRGRIVAHVEIIPQMDTMRLCGALIAQINRFRPDRVYIDMGSFGAAIYDRLREQGYRQLSGVNFGGAADDRERYGNKRAEMYDRLKRWLNDQPCSIPDDEQLKIELTNINFYQNSSGKLMMEKKEDLKKRGFKSPGRADAFCLTFAGTETYTNNRYSNDVIKPDLNWNPFTL